MRSSLSARLEGLIAPAPPPPRVAFLKTQPFAHRGLHGRGIVENSRTAFRAAVAAGHGIELDVQAAADGTAFVFHDGTLDRLTGETGRVAARPADALVAIKLTGADDTLAPLGDILTLVGGRVPVLIEIKAGGAGVSALCQSVQRALDRYSGATAVMSFNPEVAHWFGAHAPETVRGLVVSEQGETRAKGWAKRWAAMARARPDFLAYDVRDLPSRFAAAARARGMPVLTWTVRDAAAHATAAAHADAAIYETPA